MENITLVFCEAFSLRKGLDMEVGVEFIKVQEVVVLVALVKIDKYPVGIGIFQKRVRKDY